jgi:uncharacterized coiled-coil DUF342 family protein
MTMACSTLAEQNKLHAEEVKALQEKVETTDAERTCIELELTHVKAERDNFSKQLIVAQSNCRELTEQWEKLRGSTQSLHVPAASISDCEPEELGQKLKCAKSQVLCLMHTSTYPASTLQGSYHPVWAKLSSHGVTCCSG